MKLLSLCKYTIVTLCLCCLSAPVVTREMQVVFAQNYLPFSWQQDGQVQGIMKDLLDELLVKRLGIEVQYTVCPWARCQALVKNGVKDAFLTIPTLARGKYSKHAIYPIFISDFILYTGRGNKYLDQLTGVKTLDALLAIKPLRHGYILGSGWHGKKLGSAKYITKVTNSPKLLELLKFHRVDVYVEQAALLNYQLKVLSLRGDIVEIPNVMEQISWHLHIGNKSPFVKILPDLENLLRQMEQDNSLQALHDEIFARYK